MPPAKQQKLQHLKAELAKYESRLACKMKGYRGVVHESALSELRHSEVMVLRAMVDNLKREVHQLQNNQNTEET